MGNGPFNLAKAARHEPVGKVLTFGDTLKPPYSGWCWLYCADHQCGHRVPVKLRPFAEKWGFDAPVDTLCKRAVCSKCGHKGGRTITPSWDGKLKAFEPFPEGWSKENQVPDEVARGAK